MLDAQAIVHRFLEKKLQVHPDVVRYLTEQGDSALIDELVASLPGETLVVSPGHIPGLALSRDGARFLPDPACEVIKGKSGSVGNVESVQDYIHYFRDRHSRLGEMIRGRLAVIPIEALLKNSRFHQEAVGILGMISEVKTTTKGHRMLDLEDSTGHVPVLFNKDRPGFSDAETLLPDEVIGVRGTLSNDGRLFFADQLFRPDIPISHAPFLSERPGKAVLISDIHAGSTTFLAEAWHRFGDWLSGSDVSYMLIAGDIVDGIGVYPGQEHELTVPNIYEQYDMVGKLLGELPSHIRIIISPGNHDVVRGAEPQPAIPEQFRGSFPKNCTFVENPALVSLQGVQVLMYHGRSIDDMISLIPGASYQNPGPMMDGMLQRRHLASVYGKRTPIAADKQDRLLIDTVPEVLHTGHIHVTGITQYRGVLGINAGAWQSQTAFQKQMNLNPTPAQAVVLDLQTLVPEVLDFSAA